MTDDTDQTLLNRLADSRREFMKKGALATGALTLGASGTAAAPPIANAPPTADSTVSAASRTAVVRVGVNVVRVTLSAWIYPSATEASRVDGRAV